MYAPKWNQITIRSKDGISYEAKAITEQWYLFDGNQFAFKVCKCGEGPCVNCLCVAFNVIPGQPSVCNGGCKKKCLVTNEDNAMAIIQSPETRLDIYSRCRETVVNAFCVAGADVTVLNAAIDAEERDDEETEESLSFNDSSDDDDENDDGAFDMDEDLAHAEIPG
jgi:hypothetical protein